MNNRKESFNYTYSSFYREEVEAIRSKYLEPQESDFHRLKKIDSKVTATATFISIIHGLVGLGVFAVGLILSLNFTQYLTGVIMGFVGLIVMGTTPLLHRIILTRIRRTHAQEIIRLSEGLLK